MAKLKNKKDRLPNDKTLIAFVVLAILATLLIFAGIFYAVANFFGFENIAPATEDIKLTPQLLQQIAQTTVTLLGSLTVGAIAVIQYRKHKITEIQAVETRNMRFGQRLSSAVEHLGDDSVHIRMGAVYELKRLAEDSTNDRENVVSSINRTEREWSEFARHRFFACRFFSC